MFEAAGALDRLDAFAGEHGARFYGLPPNEATITMVAEPWTVPPAYPFGDDTVVPLRAGESMRWRVVA